jgi:hypothetical protein
MGPFQTLRDSIIFFFLGFPIIIISLVGFLSVGIGNVGLIVLVLGQVFIVPIAVVISHFVTNIIPFLDRFTNVSSSHMAQLIPNVPYKSGTINVFPSYWVAQTVFFFAYIFTNAYHVYSIPPLSDSPSEEWRVNNRRGRASMIMATTVFLTLFMLVMRYSVTGTETFFGTIWGLVAFSALGYGWYRVATLAGARKGDIFGIVQQMVPIPDDQNVTLCAPVNPSAE